MSLKVRSPLLKLYGRAHQITANFWVKKVPKTAFLAVLDQYYYPYPLIMYTARGLKISSFLRSAQTPCPPQWPSEARYNIVYMVEY